MPRSHAGSLDLRRWGRLFTRRMQRVPVKQETGYEAATWRGAVPPLRRYHYFAPVDRSVIGDAPKDFIHVYEPGSGSRDNPMSWPAHIAKVGQKWYPAESITEQLLTRVGDAIGIEMARSMLMECEGQIRFLSRYFLKKEESLVHGADVLASYLQDVEFVEDVGREAMESELFTFQVLCTAIHERFPAEADEIIDRFVRMIAFDALVGNQDRHLYNCGVIVHAKGRRRAGFSPVYDTARGLFWNHSEERLAKSGDPTALEKYVQGSHPMIGWDRETKGNHFRLVGNIAKAGQQQRAALLCLCSPQALDSACTVVDADFDRLLSTVRRDRIKQCLRLRFTRFEEAVSGGSVC